MNSIEGKPRRMVKFWMKEKNSCFRKKCIVQLYRQ